MEALGFDLYTQMLERTVAELRGEEVEDETSVTLNLGVDVAIPDDYISDMGQRLRTYKRVSSARDEATLASIRAETEDRYGRDSAVSRSPVCVCAAASSGGRGSDTFNRPNH